MEANHKQTKIACIIKRSLLGAEFDGYSFNGGFQSRGRFFFPLSLNVSMSARCKLQ